MDTRYLPFYGGLYGGSLQPYLYSLYNGYGTPFGMYGNVGYGNLGGYGMYSGYGNMGYGNYGIPTYGYNNYFYGMPFGFYGNMGYGGGYSGYDYGY
ncbi:MAG TPA: hypothetical protein VHP38_07115 [Ruminiclostridium sp.]|nr:hypothetical protein [Ruminiclostridium sp.]